MPLDQYLKQFNELVPILQMKPEEIIKKIDLEDEQHPKEIQTLKEEIEQCYTKERDMILRMPDCMRIGVFKIHIKEIV